MTTPMQILYVDDEPALLDIGKIYLERSINCQITTFESPIEALPAIQSGQYDAIISDYQMPDIDGIEFLRQVRASGSRIPFILFTGRGREEIVIQALNEGADFYLQKGGDPSSQFTELAHKVRQAVHQRQLEMRIRNAERREADIIDFLPDATFAIDTEGIIIAWNKAMERMTGLSSDQMLGQGDYEYALPFYHTKRPMLINLVMGDDPLTAAKYTRIKKDGEHLSTEITLPVFRGKERASFWFTASPLYNSQGTMVGAIESIREITENKRAEEALRLDESRLEALLHLSQMTHKSLGDITSFAMEQAVKLTGSSLGYVAFVSEDESLLTMHAWSDAALIECQINEKPLIYPVESTGLWGETIRQKRPVITNDYAAPNPLKKGVPSGHVHLIRHLGVPIFDGDKIVVVAGVGNKNHLYDSSDIRQLELLMGGMWSIIKRNRADEELFRKHEELHAAYEEITATEEELRSNLEELCRQESALRESERRLSHMASNIPGVAYRFVVKPDGSYGLDFIGERSREILGIENDPVTFFDNITRGIAPSSREQFLDSITQAIQNQEPWRFKGEFQKPSGEKIWIRAISNPAREGETLLFDGIIFDETAHKMTDDLVHLLIRITDDIPVSIIVHDDDGAILYANDHAFRLLGYTRDEFLAKNVHDIDASGSEQLITEQIGVIRTAGRGEFDIHHIHRDGSLIPLHITVKAIEWKGKEVFLSIAKDMRMCFKEQRPKFI